MLNYFETVYVPQVLFDRSQRWQQEAAAPICYLSDHFGHDLLLSEQTDSLAAVHFRWLLNSGLRPATVNKHRAAWFAVWRHAYRAGLVPVEPKVKRLAAEHAEPDAWTLGEVTRLFAAAESFQIGRSYGGIPRCLYWHALLRIAYWTALRRGSLLSIRRADVDRESGWLHVPSNRMKNKRAKRFRLGSDAIAAINQIWEPARDRLFPVVSTSAISKHFGLILLGAEIADGYGCSLNKFHKIRRTVATHVAVIAGHGAASSLLGHRSQAITTQSYIAPSHLPGNDFTAILPEIARLAPPSAPIEERRTA